MEKEVKTKKPHTLELKNRSECSIDGVEKVISSSEKAISIITSAGALEIEGKNMHIVKFDADSEQFCVSGEIDLLKYNGQKVGLFKRLFK